MTHFFVMIPIYAISPRLKNHCHLENHCC